MVIIEGPLSQLRLIRLYVVAVYLNHGQVLNREFYLI